MRKVCNVERIWYANASWLSRRTLCRTRGWLAQSATVRSCGSDIEGGLQRLERSGNVSLVQAVRDQGARKADGTQAIHDQVPGKESGAGRDGGASGREFLRVGEEDVRAERGDVCSDGVFGGRWVVAPLDGKARIKARQVDLFTCAPSDNNSVHDFSFTTRLDFDGDTVKLTPQLNY